jgi:hypothetical protein
MNSFGEFDQFTDERFHGFSVFSCQLSVVSCQLSADCLETPIYVVGKIAFDSGGDEWCNVL